MEKKITAMNLTEELAEKCGISISSADTFVRTFFDVIIEGLEKDGIVKIKGWGTFKFSAIKDRESVDVNTGERIVIKGYRKVAFLPETSLKEYINRPFSQFETTELNDDFQLDDEPVEVTEQLTEIEETVEVKEQPVEEVTLPITEIIQPVEESAQPAAFLNTDAAEQTSETPMAVVPEVTEETKDVTDTLAVPEASADSEITEEPVAEETEMESLPEIEEEPESLITPETPEKQEIQEPSATPEQTEVPKQAVVAENKPRKSWKYWLPILLLVLITLCLFIYLFFGKGFSKPKFSINSSEKDKIRVEAITFDDDAKASKKINVTFPERKQKESEVSDEEVNEELETELAESSDEASEAVEELKGELKDEPKEEVKAETTEEVKEEPQKVEPKETPKTTEAEPKNEVPQTKPKVTAPAGNPLEKNLKDITFADTLGHTIEGTLATHTLQVDETIVRLAQKYYGDKRLWPYIVKYNAMKNPNSIVVGNTIKIPKLKAKE